MLIKMKKFSSVIYKTEGPCCHSSKGLCEDDQIIYA